MSRPWIDEFLGDGCNICGSQDWIEPDMKDVDHAKLYPVPVFYAMREMLLRLEWTTIWSERDADGPPSKYLTCPDCRGQQPHHTMNCALAALLEPLR